MNAFVHVVIFLFEIKNGATNTNKVSHRFVTFPACVSKVRDRIGEIHMVKPIFNSSFKHYLIA